MWRPLARRGLLNRLTATPIFRPSIIKTQVPEHETVILALPYTESASSFPHFETRSSFCQSPRFFSANSSEIYEDPVSEASSDVNGETGGIDFSAFNAFDGKSKPEFENEGSVFDEAIGSSEAREGFDGESYGSFPLNENIGSMEVEDENNRLVKENDPEKVENLLSLLQSSGTTSGSLESSLDRMVLALDEDFVLKVLKTPYIPGENLIGFFNWILKKPEFKISTSILDVLVKAICQANSKSEIYSLWDMVKVVGEKEKGVVSTDSLNELIAQFAMLGKGKAAFDVFEKFDDFGCLLNADTFYFTIEALCKRGFYGWACSVCEKMLNADKLPDEEKIGKIISYLCKGGKAKDAHLVYLYAKDKKMLPPRSSINFLISSLSQIKRSKKGTHEEIDKELDKETVSLALEMLGDYSTEDRKYAVRPFSSIIKKLCWIQEVDRAKSLILEMVDSGPPPGNALFNCVINGLVKVGGMEEALKILKLMESRGLKPDVYTYNVIMSGYARSGKMEEACEILEKAKKKHSKMSPTTYHSLIRGFCRLEQFDNALNLLAEMKQYGVNPTHDEYNKLIKSLCFKALDWENADKLREEMKANGLILNGRTSALIRAIKELKEEVSAEVTAPA